MMALLRAMFRHYLALVLPERRFMRGFIGRHLPRTAARLAIEIGSASSPYNSALQRALPGLRLVRSDLQETGADVVADVQRLPFAGNAADLLVAIHVLQYPADLDAAFREMRRVLKPGGYVLAVCPYLSLIAGLQDRRRWSADELAACFAAAGFEPVALERTGGAWLCLADIPAQRLGALFADPARWRSSGGLLAAFTYGVSALLALPFHLLGQLGLSIDRLLPPAERYIGTAILARRGGDV